MKVAAPTHRTFYIEKTGDKYTLVKVFEVNDPKAAADMQNFAMHRVMTTTVDERIMAEQTIVIKAKNGHITIEGEPMQVKQATAVAEIILKSGSGEA